MDKNFKKKLNKDEYTRPKLTYTDKLTKDDIEDMLEDYKQVLDINKIPVGSHLRYFTMKNNVKKFRTGGVLHNNTGLPDYIVLSNGTRTWSVQTKNTTFFKKMNINEIKAEYEDIITDLEKKVTMLEKKNDELRFYIVELKKSK